jgi:uncharacterized repeat protein (TIGR03803 family)
MKRSYTLAGACLSATLLAACGGANNGLSSSPVTSVEPQQSQSSQPASARSRSHGVKRASETLTYLHSFRASGDGTNPYGPLVSLNGTLYGTTLNATGVCGGGGACGTVYSVTPSGTYALLLGFNNTDGASPYAGLLNVNGTLYGTTSGGGPSGEGTVYSITTSGTESVLQNFYSGSDGSVPYATLINVSGTFYGTTSTGGVYNQGTVFSMTASGVETVLHNFGGSGDGTDPLAPLLDIGNTLYGTTNQGGAYGSGTVYAVSKSTGTETLLHSFGGSSGDGTRPEFGRLISVGGALYGTTQTGGPYNGGGNCYSQGCGVLFSIIPSGTYAIVHSFGSLHNGVYDGEHPYSGLVDVSGTLYGTTSRGGAYDEGTVYSISTTSAGAETVLWAFGGTPGGSQPKADLINVSGTLYGTTTTGGTYNEGTFFSLLSN